MDARYETASNFARKAPGMAHTAAPGDLHRRTAYLTSKTISVACGNVDLCSSAPDSRLTCPTRG
jgi:hypothetical protein